MIEEIKMSGGYHELRRIATSGATISILGEAAILILVEAATSIEVAVVLSFRAEVTDLSDGSPRRVVG